jgi:hypothetical protein
MQKLFPSRKHEILKARNLSGLLFVFSSFRAFVINLDLVARLAAISAAFLADCPV